MKFKNLILIVFIGVVLFSSMAACLAKESICDDDGVMTICLSLNSIEMSKDDLLSITKILREEIPTYDEGEATINCRLSFGKTLCEMNWRAFEICGEMTFDLYSKTSVQNINELWVRECSP